MKVFVLLIEIIINLKQEFKYVSVFFKDLNKIKDVKFRRNKIFKFRNKVEDEEEEEKEIFSIFLEDISVSEEVLVL